MAGGVTERLFNGVPPQIALNTILPASVRTPTKKRSFSDSTPTEPRLSPSPKFKEPLPRTRDDNSLITTPSNTPGADRSTGLVLQMPNRDNLTSKPGLYSPQSDQRDPYESPTSVLPRHSRGLDFSRACTNLHHSTIPDHQSPDSSPSITHKGLNIPSRRQSTISIMMMESPKAMATNAWGGGDRGFQPRSLGSTTAMTSDASASSSDDDETMTRNGDPEDFMSTPQMNRQYNNNAVTPFGLREEAHLGGWSHAASPISRRYHPFRRDRPARADKDSNKDLSLDVDMDTAMSRRESLSAPTNGLQITSSNESGDEGPFKFQQSTPGVVRRPVTRRSNLLPKTKGFARIRAALQEESAPIDSEFKREAEVVRQVRVKDVGSLKHGHSTASSSPDLTPNIPSMPMDASEMSDLDGPPPTMMPYPPKVKPPDERRGSTSKEFWPHLYNGTDTPPPPLFHTPRSSSGISEDMKLDSPAAQTPISNPPSTTAGAISDFRLEADYDSSTALPPPQFPSAAEISRKVGKRRRDEDFDPMSIKRRAVSPGMSVHSSPILGQSPVSSTGGWWGPQKQQRENSNSSAPDDIPALPAPILPPKRMGMQQGMTDTNAGFTKMTLE